MNTKSAYQDQWDACPKGELQRMVERIKVRRQRRMVTRVGGVAAALLMAFATGYFGTSWLRPSAEDPYDSIACSEVNRLLPSYLAKQLDADSTRRIDAHLQKCPMCAATYRRMVMEISGTAHLHRASDSDAVHSHRRVAVSEDDQCAPARLLEWLRQPTRDVFHIKVADEGGVTGLCVPFHTSGEELSALASELIFSQTPS